MQMCDLTFFAKQLIAQFIPLYKLSTQLNYFKAVAFDLFVPKEAMRVH